jgi:hypothetical protein
MLRLSIPKNNIGCSKNCLYKSNTLKSDHSLCAKNSLSKSTNFVKKSHLAQREAEYDKNLKSIVKYKPSGDLRSSRENIKPNIMRRGIRERSRSVVKKLLATIDAKSTPREVSYILTEKENDMCLDNFREEDEEVRRFKDQEVNILDIVNTQATTKRYVCNSNRRYDIKDDVNLDHIINSVDLSSEKNNLINVDNRKLTESLKIYENELHNTNKLNFLTKNISIEINPNNCLAFFQEGINRINLGIFTYNYENLKINKEHTAKFTHVEYRRLLTTLLEYEYGKIILENLILDEQITLNFLDRHNITERMRSKMIDWMIEVLGNYNCDDNTFFLSVNIMDRYFSHCEEILKPEDLHIIGICSMFIASKFYDIFPIKLKMMTDKVSHGKFRPEEIKQMEERIIKTLGYCVYTSTIHDFINHYVEQIFFFIENSFHIHDENLSEYIMCIYKASDIRLDCVYYEKHKLTKNYTMKMLNLLQKVLTYITKMICYDYDLIGVKASLLSASSLLVGLKICEEINNDVYVNNYFMGKLAEISGHNEFDIVTHSQKILYNAQNFDLIFQGLGNLKKRHFNFTIEDIVL